MKFRCYHCGESLEGLSLPFGRLDQCGACGRFIHACRMCCYFEPNETSKQCTEDDAEKVHDKVNANFCDYFEPSMGAFDGTAHRSEQRARAALDELFGGTGSEPASDSAEPRDEALARARALFDD